jgi:undecaprenyl-diphosphatase
MLNLGQIIFLALLQGVTELFPISSLGHTVIFPALFGWGNITTDTACDGASCFLPMITALHLGTCIALLIYFWRDWFQVGKTLVVSIKDGEVRRHSQEWVSWLVIIGTIPAAILGVFLERPLKTLFANPVLTATFLFANGSLLFLAESLRRRAETNLKNLSPKERETYFRPLASLTWKEAIVVGLAQALALIPGFSRSGSTMVAGLGLRLTHEDAARYSFLLATPVIFGAAILEVPELFNQNRFPLGLIFLGIVLAGVAAYFSTKFLTKYFEKGRLDPFAYYCWAAGLISLFLFIFVLPGH